MSIFLPFSSNNGNVATIRHNSSHKCGYRGTPIGHRWSTTITATVTLALICEKNWLQKIQFCWKKVKFGLSIVLKVSSFDHSLSLSLRFLVSLLSFSLSHSFEVKTVRKCLYAFSVSILNLVFAIIWGKIVVLKHI